MKLQVVSDKQIVKDFLITAANNSGAEFLASLEWAAVLKTEENVETFGLYEGDELLAVFNLIKKDLKFNLVYYYLPRGPVFARDLSESTQAELWRFLITEFKNKGAIFLRVEPRNTLPAVIKSAVSINLQPQTTLMLDLSLSEADLFKAFHPKTRYNIRLAEKKGVVIDNSASQDAFNNFWSLMTATGKRDGFKVHGQKHYQTLALTNPDFIKLFVAKIDGQTIAAGLFSFYGDKVTYLHGASDYNSRQLMAPYLLQWTVIKYAQTQGYKYYDFYGIDELKWPGVTRFKTGFSGFKVAYAGTQDLVLNSFVYKLYNFLRRLRRLV